jgi:hypothetical protein
VRNKLSSVKRLAAALAPLPDLAELKAEGNPICHQPEEQEPYRVRVLTALPLLRYLDDEEVTEAERMWIKWCLLPPRFSLPKATLSESVRSDREVTCSRMCVCVCVRARACVCAYMGVCVCVCVCVCVFFLRGGYRVLKLVNPSVGAVAVAATHRSWMIRRRWS